jgi:tetratricopeptide (TPR) repeat protein
MNKLVHVIYFFSFFYLLQAVAQHSYAPLLVVVIMVKNEETVMRATLQPFIEGGVDSFFVLDTGSTDRTVAVTKEFFAEYGIEQGYIAQEPFIDFATSRNHALDLAHEQFPHAAFMLMIDAEWYINDARALVDFCQSCLRRGDIYPSYLVRIGNETFDNYVCRLIRCNYGVCFAGVVHETIIQQTQIKAPKNIFFEYLPAAIGIEASYARFIRDRELLYKEYQKNSHDTRTLFYLACTCENLGDLEAAYAFYKERVAIIGFDEEDFIAYYRLAETIKKLILQKSYTGHQWSEALAYYTKAYRMRPHRAEPLVGIADCFLAIGQMDLAYLYAYRAVALEYPTNDFLFIENHLYNYYRYELFARCAGYVNEFEIDRRDRESNYFLDC